MKDSIITNDLLTKEEINELANILKNNEDEEINVDSSIEIELRFKKAIKYIHDNYENKFSKMSIDNMFRWIYYLGVNTDVSAKNISIEEVMKTINDAEFFELVSNAINNPDKIPNTVISVDDENNIIKLESSCIGCECDCAPQREDHCISESNDPLKCVITIPMKRFNKIIGIDEENK